MTTLGHMIWAELLKLKRTLALWLVGLAPLTLVLLFVLIIGASGMSPGEAGWGMIGRQAVGMWAFFMLPLFIALETALLNGIDHKEHAWKRLYTLPIPRWTVYAAKLLIALVLVGVSSLLLSVSLPLMFFVVQSIPAFGISASSIPWWEILRSVTFAYLGAWLILVLHHWISMRWSSFTVALGVAVVATMGIIQIGSSEWWIVYPWTFPLTASSGSDPANQLLAVTISMVGSVVVALIAGWEVTRRDVL